jgi:hypothetical protein
MKYVIKKKWKNKEFPSWFAYVDTIDGYKYIPNSCSIESQEDCEKNLRRILATERKIEVETDENEEIVKELEI